MTNDIQPEILIGSAGDVEIQYLHYQGDGPALVLLHATGFNPWLWHPIAKSLAPRYNIIAPYFCDHRQAEPEGGMGWMVLAQDLVRLCDTLGLKQPYLAGHSMGATISIMAHAAWGLPAGRMMLIEPIILPEIVYTIGVTLEQHPLASQVIKRRNEWASIEEAMNYLNSKSLFKQWDREMIDLYIRYGMIAHEEGGLTLACQPAREAALFMGGILFNPWPLLPKVRCRTLVLEGETSENQAYIDLPKIASLIPGSEYFKVKKAGHLIPMEHPGEIIQLMQNFFS